MPSLAQPIIVSSALTVQMLLLGYATNQIFGVWDNIPGPAQNIWLKTFFGLTVGFAVDTTALFLLGLAGWLSGIASVITLATITLLAASQLKPKFDVRPQLPQLLSIAATLLLFVAIILSAIRVPGVFDDTSYHLPLARYYVAQQQITLQPYLRFPLSPQNMELLFALGLMTGGTQFGAEIVAQFLATVPLFITCLGLIGALRWTTGATWPGFFASTLLLGLGPVHVSLGYAYVDDGLILYCWATLLAIALSIVHGDRSWRSPWLLAGFAAGMAMGTKYFGAILVSLSSLWLLTVRRDWRATLIYSGTALIFGSWWYIRSWLISGDPLHPVGGPIFGYFLWDAQDLIDQMQEQASHGVTKSISNLWYSIKTAGVGAFALVPLSLIYWRRLGPGLSLILGVTLCYFAFWFYTSQVERYLAPIAAAAAFLSIWTIWQMGQSFTQSLFRDSLKITRSKTAGAFLCVIAVVVPANNALEQSRNELQHWHQILEQRPGYSLMQYANQLISSYGNRLVNVGFENAVYFYNGIVIGDWFGPGRYRQMIRGSVRQCSDVCRLIPPEAMREVMMHFNALTLLVNRKRFEIDLAAYQRDFTLQQLTPDGALFTLNKIQAQITRQTEASPAH
jgi:hypothetical protein